MNAETPEPNTIDAADAEKPITFKDLIRAVFDPPDDEGIDLPAFSMPSAPSFVRPELLKLEDHLLICYLLHFY